MFKPGAVEEFLAVTAALREHEKTFVSVFGFDIAAMVEVKLAYDKLGGTYPITPAEVRRVFNWEEPCG
jgi:hypothetical protein